MSAYKYFDCDGCDACKMARKDVFDIHKLSLRKAAMFKQTPHINHYTYTDHSRLVLTFTEIFTSCGYERVL